MSDDPSKNLPDRAPEAGAVSPAPTGTAPHPAPAADAEAHTRHDAHSGHLHHPQLPTFTFLEELKRRNIGRVAILYVGVAYVALEIFELFFHLLEMPAWSGRASVLLAVIGFPVALTIAWIYEITPEGLKPTDEVPIKKSIAVQTGRRLDRAIIVVLAIALAYFVADKFWMSGHPRHAAEPESVAEHSEARSELAGSQAKERDSATTVAAIPEKSVAVLSFVDLSEKKDQEYFADGLAEELINVLARNPDLRVPARTSSFFFKGKQERVEDIARQLGVANIVEGSVRKEGRMLRITAQLIRADSGYHLWSKTFDRKVDDIFRIQDEISAAVASALNATLAGKAQQIGAGTANVEAYDFFVQARTLVHRGDANAAIPLLDQALKLDPRFVRALALRSTAKCRLYIDMRDGPARVAAIARCREEAADAVAQDPALDEAYIALGQSYLFISNESNHRAIPEFQRAIKLNPRNSDAYLGLATIASWWLRFEEALPLAKRAYELDPVNIEVLHSLGCAYTSLNQLPEAEATFRRLISLEPTNKAYFQSQLAAVLAARGKTVDARSLYESTGLESESSRLWVEALLGPTAGRPGDSSPALMQLEHSGAKDVSPIDIAEIYAFHGELDKAFDWMELQSQTDPVVLVRELRCDPLLVKAHRDPRFQVLRRKLDLHDIVVSDVAGEP